MAKDSSPQNDVLLLPWLQMVQTVGPEPAELALGSLVEEHIQPVIKSVIRFKLRLDVAQSTDAADLAQEALTQWLSELRKLSIGRDQHSISDARGLAATITYRVCYGWLRQRSPRRHALRKRLQYVLTRQAGLALWTDERKQLIAGFAAWRGIALAPDEELRRLPDDNTFLKRVGRMINNPQELRLNDLLAAIFDHIGGPVALDQLVSAAATILQIRDELPSSTDEQEEEGGPEIASKEDLARQVEKRIFLERLWEEVRELPRPQRVALLLNLREADGRGCLALFPATGVATVRQLAAALEIPPERLAELWGRLPLGDAAIGDLLDLTRQQVINVRKSARERLARRLRGFF